METIRKIKIASSIVVASLLFVSCSETVLKEEHDAQISYINEENQTRFDSLNRSYIATLNDIDQNLDEIRNLHGVLVIGPNSNTDVGISKKEQILNNIKAINGLLAQNKIKLAQLESNLIKYKKGKEELKIALEHAKTRMQNQEQEIQALKQTLIANNFKIEELNQALAASESKAADMIQANKEQKEVIEKKFFAYGTKQQLEDKQVFAERKGLRKIFGKKELNSNLSRDEFAKINMYEDTKISMLGTDPKLISKHPANSYTIEANGDNLTQLTITNPDEFWKITNYLVVQVKN